MHCWTRYLFIIVVAVLATGQMIAACGQKGDLFIPKAEPGETEAEDAAGASVPEVQTGESPEVQEDTPGPAAQGKGGGE
jgi:predicted small lipoprotein YifL